MIAAHFSLSFSFIFIDFHHHHKFTLNHNSYYHHDFLCTILVDSQLATYY